MVFELALSTLRNNIVSENWQAALDNLNTLRSNIEERYATLTPAQQLRWEDTRRELLHTLNHLEDGIIKNQGILLDTGNLQVQKNRILRFLDGIKEI